MRENVLFDLNIDHYTIDELLIFLNISNDNLTQSIIENSINTIKNNGNSQDKEFYIFLNNIQTKLNVFLNTSANSQQYIPMSSNYNITNTTNSTMGNNHEIIHNKSIPVANTNNYEYPTGIINPIERRTTTKTISIDSIYRHDYSNTSSTDFTWKLPVTEHKVVSLKLSSIELPIKWYSVSNKNGTNRFKLSLYNISNVNDTSYEIIIPSGNYTYQQMENSINNAMENQNVLYIKCVISPITCNTVFRLKTSSEYTNSSDDITNDENANYSPNFYYDINFNTGDFENCKQTIQNRQNCFPSNTLGSYLGFVNDIYSINLNDNLIDNITQTPSITYNGYISSETSYENRKLNYIFVSVNDFIKNNIINSVITTDQQSALGDNILGRISITEEYNSTMINNSNDLLFKQRDYMGPVNLNNFNIKLMDKYGNTIDLNNNDFSLSFEITCLY